MTSAAAVAVSSSIKPSYPESITPTCSFEDRINRNESHHDNTSQVGDDWWNEDLLIHQDYDPFRPTTATTSIQYDLNHNENGTSQSLPFRIIRPPPKLKSFPSSNMTTSSSLRIQDVLERLDLDQVITPETVIVDQSHGNNNTTASSATIDHNDQWSAGSVNPNDTFDSYFWNTKSPCKWYHHHHNHHNHHPKSCIHTNATTNHKRPRYSPRQQTSSSSSSPQVLVEWGTTTMTNDFTFVNDTTLNTHQFDWTSFPWEDSLDHNDHCMSPFITRTSEHSIDGYMDEMAVTTTSSSSLLSIVRSIESNMTSSMVSSSLDGTTISYTTPVRTTSLRKYPSKRCRYNASKTNTSGRHNVNVLSLATSSLDIHSRTTCVDDSIPPPLSWKSGDADDVTGLIPSFASPIPEPTNIAGNYLDDDHDEDDDEKYNVQSVTMRATTEDNDTTMCHLLHQKGSIKENDLLSRSNRQVLHRLIYKQVMGIHITN